MQVKGLWQWQKWLETLAGLALLSMLLLTVADVLGRYVFSRPVPGVVELIQYAMVVVVFLGLPVVTARRSHVSVGLLDAMMSATTRRVSSVVVSLTSALVLGAQSWVLFTTASFMLEYGDVIGFLRLPTYPAAYLMSALSAVGAWVCLASALDRRQDQEPAPDASPH